MHFELVLAGLAVFAAAAPIERAADGSSYGSYDPYQTYGSYSPYSGAVEGEAGKMQQKGMAFPTAQYLIMLLEYR